MIAVRAIRPGDETAWRALWHGYLRYYEKELCEQIYATSFARLCDPDITDYHGLIATLHGRQVGLAHYIFHRHGWKLENVVYLQDLYVAPDIRGTGAGRTLIEGVYAAADAAGCPEVYWLTEHFNAPGRRLYDRVGELTPFIKYRRG
jgi:GNAT superfamily N-acetyltransferase